jgi:phage-related baseplate assembly protein
MINSTGLPAGKAGSTRHFPDISFVDTDPMPLLTSLISAYELFTNRRLYPADPTRKFIEWITDIIIQERVIINESAKQNVPRYAEGEYLDSLAEIFKDAERLQPQPARTTMRCHLSVARPSAQTIPRGTRVTVDGVINFETTESITIPPGQLYGDAPAICLTPGTTGNGFAPGQITQLIDIYQFYERVENITMSSGGADKETDDAFYERLRDSMESFSTAGSVGAYIYWTKTASARIIDVRPTSPVPGVADIRVLLENGEMPDEEMIQLIHETLSGGDDGVRPFTDHVIVSGPEPKYFDIDATYFIPAPRTNSAALIQAETERALQSYIRWQTERMGRDLNPSRLNKMLMTSGIKRTEIRKPEFTVVEENSVAVLRECNLIYGGIENE